MEVNKAIPCVLSEYIYLVSLHAYPKQLDPLLNSVAGGTWFISIFNHTHACTRTHTQIYMCVCVCLCVCMYVYVCVCVWKEGNVLFNDALNTFLFTLYGVRHMVKDHSDSERGNPLPAYRLLVPIRSKSSFICIIPQTG